MNTQTLAKIITNYQARMKIETREYRRIMRRALKGQ